MLRSSILFRSSVLLHICCCLLCLNNVSGHVLHATTATPVKPEHSRKMGGQYSSPHKDTKHLHDFVEKLPDMDGKTCAITGTTTGLGFIAARSILRRRGA